MKRTILLGLVLAGVVVGMVGHRRSIAQDSGATGTMAIGDLRVDFDNKQISFPATVCDPGETLEMLVCKTGTKEHESILATTVPPSSVHAGLLALGLKPGQPARWISLEDGDGVMMSPRGGAVAIELSWTDAEGALHTATPWDWLTLNEFRAPGDDEAEDAEDGDERASVDDIEKQGGDWVFVGSDIMATGGYWADGSGDLISTANFSSTVLDVPFVSSESNRELMFRANTDAIPPAGTKVTVTLIPAEDAAESPYVREWLFVGADGDLLADGEDVAMADLQLWAMTLASKHRHVQVVVWIDPAVPAQRVQQVWESVRIGGVYDIREVRAASEELWLPLTASQKAELIADMTDRFENPKDFSEAPHDRMRRLQESVASRQIELQRQQDLLRAMSEELTRFEVTYPEPVDDEDAAE